MCNSGTRKWIGYKFVWTIEDTENKHWHFAPFANFGLGGVVFVNSSTPNVDADNGTMKVKNENDQWYSNNRKKPDLAFSVQINGKVKITV